MCADCLARQQLNDRLLRQLDEQHHLLMQMFLKHLTRRRARQRLGQAKRQLTRVLA